MTRCVCVLLVFLVIGAETVTGQTFIGFGRNKIQYSDFKWRILQTEHFDIYYYTQMGDLAERAAFWAEESYDYLSDKLNYEIDRKTPLIFYSSHLHFQQTNVSPFFIPEGVAGFFEFLKGRVVIPSDGDWHRFKRVIRHELAHVFTYSKMGRIYRDHRSVRQARLPLWFTEGIAEYLSGEWDAQSEMVIRDAVLSDNLVPMTQIHRINGTYQMYKEGENFLRFIDKKYGEETVLLIIENLWRSKNFIETISSTVGKPFEELNKEWVYQLKKRYYPKLEVEDLPSIIATNITKSGFNNKPVFFKNGLEPMVAFVANRTGYTSIYTQSLDPEKKKFAPTLVVKGESTADLESFHPFRSRMDANKNSELAFITKSGEQDVLHVWDLLTGENVSTIGFDSLVALSSPSWSPDGRQIAFSALNFGGNADLYIYDYPTGELHQLTDDFYNDRDPAWSPQGRYLAFASDRGNHGETGHYNLFMIDLELNRLEYLTAGESIDVAPAWSPDGDYLVYTSVTSGATDIWMMKMEDVVEPGPLAWNGAISGDILDSPPLLNRVKRGVDRRKITALTSAAFDPEWTDDDQLLFGAFEGFRFNIMMMDDVMEKYHQAEPAPESLAFTEHRAWDAPIIVEKTDFEAKEYIRNYSMDFAVGQVTQDPIFGTTGGTQLFFSDLLGNDYYNFVIYNNARTQDDFMNSFNFAISRVSSGRRLNWVYGLYHFDFLAFQNRQQFFEENQYGGFVTAVYPLSMFNRVEFSTIFASDDKEFEFPTLRRRKALLLSNFLTVVHDNSIWGSTGPMDGGRYSFTLGHTTDIQYSNVAYMTLIGDVRHYMRLGARITYATRAMLLFTKGRDTQRFFMGGSWDLRGYDRFSLWGNRLGLLSQELRFPLLDVLAFGFPHFNLVFPGLRGALFFDVGNAWVDDFEGILGSYGAGARFPMGFFTLRLDAGKRIQDNFHSIQDGLFWQFFFGYDF